MKILSPRAFPKPVCRYFSLEHKSLSLKILELTDLVSINRKRRTWTERLPFTGKLKHTGLKRDKWTEFSFILNF